MNETVETITPAQALGVALSAQAETMTMGEAQDRGPAMLDHLHRMGFDVLALSDTREPDSLDVERLARAMHEQARCGRGAVEGPHALAECRYESTFLRNATGLVAADARLSETSR